MRLHTFSVYLGDRPGVLNRVASLIRRRGFNIESLAVGHSELAGISRMTAVVETDEAGARRVEANLYKLVDVVRVEDITGQAALERELALIKVSADQQTRPSLLQLAHVFHARVVDVAPESIVIEMVRTGRVALLRGSGAGVARAAAPANAGLEEGIACSV